MMGKSIVNTLALDLDGTILSHDYKISPRVLMAIAEFKRVCGNIIIATGRSRRSAMNFYKIIAEARAPASAMICQNGSLVYDFENNPEGELLKSSSLEKKIARKVIELSRKIEMDFHAFEGDSWYYEKFYPGTEIYKKRAGFDGIVVNFDELENFNFNKLMFVSNQENYTSPELLELEQELLILCKNKAEVFFSGQGFLEVTPKNVDKAASIEFWLKTRGLKLKNLMAIGDADNDRAMLQKAGLGVVMGNANPRLKSQISNITLGIEEDGAALAIEKFLSQKTKK